MAHREIRKLIPMGDSIGVTLPKPWLDFNNMKSGDSIEITTYGNTATIKLKNGGNNNASIS